MAQRPKSFWGASPELADTEKQWITEYDDSPVMALEAELIYAATSRGIPWDSALDMELWQLASALGLHRVETRAERDQREIVEAKSEYWDETKRSRADKLSDYHARRKERELERRKAKREGKA